jgi:hypothetical protein
MPIGADALFLAAVTVITSPIAGAVGGYVVGRFKPLSARTISPAVGSHVDLPFTVRGVLSRPLRLSEQIWFVSCNQDGAERYWPQGRAQMSGTEFRYSFKNESMAPNTDVTFLFALASKTGAKNLNAIREEWDRDRRWPGIADLPSGVMPVSDIGMYEKNPKA